MRKVIIMLEDVQHYTKDSQDSRTQSRVYSSEYPRTILLKFLNSSLVLLVYSEIST